MKKTLCPTLPQGLGPGYDPKIAFLPYFGPDFPEMFETGPLEDTKHPPPRLALGSLYVNFDLGNVMGHVGVIVVSKFTSWDGFSCC